MRLFWTLIVAGVAWTLVHEALYRRFTPGPGDFELGGTITHAGVDMLSVTLVLAGVAFIATTNRRV